MSNHVFKPVLRRSRAARLVIGAVGAGVVLLGGWVSATEPWMEPITRVEEDWRIVLIEPDNHMDTPQFHTVMSPFGDLDSVYAQATWNYWELPEFASGGLQLEVWDQEECTYERAFGSEPLSTDAETITWTQVLATNGEVLSFRIENGHSTTWGSFGGLSLHGSIPLPSLNAYNPGVSVGNSLVTFGANRVEQLVITEVRLYGPAGLLARDSTPRVVYELNSD